MAVTVTRSSSLFTDNDGDTVADPGDIVLVHILVQNTNATDILNLKVYDTQNGLTITDLTSVKITPIALDDFTPAAPLTIVGNTPYIVSASALLGNDVDPDGPEASLTISSFTNLNHVTVTDAGGGNYQIVPETGYQGVASFEYFITDAQGLTSVTTGKVNILISGMVWYVDSNGNNATGDGSYLKPFTNLGKLNDDGTGAAGTVGPNDNVKGDDDVDGAGDTIFVFNNNSAYTGGITLEAGQKLYGDGHEMTVNGYVIGVAGQTNNSTINYSTYGVTLATDNTIAGLTLNGTANTAVGIQDGNGSVTTSGGTLNVDTVTISGAGQAVDIDQGGNLNVTLTSLSTTGTAAGLQGVQLSGTASSGTALISGTFTASGGSIAGESSHGFQIGGQGPSSGGTVSVTYGGTIGSSSTGSAVNIADRLAGAGSVTFSGNISQTSTSTNTSAGIALSNIAGGTIDFDGTKTINVTSGIQNAIQISSQSGGTVNFDNGAIDIDFATGTTGHAFAVSAMSGGSVNVTTAADIDMVGTASGRGINIGSSTAGSVNFTGGNLTISTRDGAGLFDSNSAGSTNALNISGSGNTISTTNGGQLVEIANAATTGITFNTLTTGASVTNTAVHVNNLDGGSFNTTTITVTGTSGAGSDGVRIEGGSTASFNLGTVGVSNASDDGIEINGAGNGAVTIDSISVQNALTGQGVEINGATSAVTITAGGIGNTNDPAAQGVLITGGNGNVTIGASVSKTTSGNVVDVNNHTGGTIAFGGTISTSLSGGGVTLVNNTGSTINFTNTLSLNTSSTGTVAFNATGGGTVSASAANSTINSGAGVGLNVVNTGIGAADLNFQSVTVNGAANGIILNNTGSAGGLTITGTGTTDGTGGTIQNTTGRGIDIQNAVQIKLSNMTLTNAGTTDLDSTNGGLSLGDNLSTNAAINLVNVTNVTLTNVDITGGAEQGINGNNVANFNLINSSITNVGNEADEDNIHFYNMSGTSSIINTVLTHTSGGGDDNLNLQMQSGNLDLTISGGSATGNGTIANNQGSGYLFGIRGTAIANINIDGASSTNHFSGGIVADAFDTATMNLRVNNTTSSGNNDQLSVSAGDSSKVDLEVTNNTLSSLGSSDFVALGLLGSAFDTGYVFDARISGNTITIASGVTGDGVFVNNAGGGQINVAMTNNTINYSGTQRAVVVQAGQDGNGTTNATIQSNTIDMKNSGALANPAFLIQSAVTGPGNTSSINLNMGGAGALANTFIHSGGGTIAAGDIRVRQRNDGTINLDGYVGGGQDTTAIANYLNARNNEISPSTATVDGTTPHNYTGNATPTFITVTVSASTVAEDGGNLIYTFTRDGSAAGSLVANFSITGTATAGTDFIVAGATTFSNATGLGTITFAAGSSTATITVDPSSDATAETDESVVVDAGNSATAHGGFARAFITNDDGPVFMQMTPDSKPADVGAIDQAQPDPAAPGQAPGGAPAVDEVTSPPVAPADNAGGVPAAPAVNDDGRISETELKLLVSAAIDRWAANGATAEQIAAMKAVKVSVADMMGVQIGGASAGIIQIDNDAAGYGWFVDSTPGDDSEFTGSGDRLFAAAGSGASGRVDLLTVLIHELGHQIGLGDDYSSAGGVDAMYGYMDVGERRLPASGDSARATGQAPTQEAFILAPVADVGTLPANKSVDIQYKATVNSFFNQVIGPLSNFATATGDNISDTNSNTNVTTVDTLTLGDRVYVDANNNGIFDAGEGKNGVALTLFADTNNNGVLDIGTDVQLLTTTTAGVGAAIGSYSFAGLSPGNYIVRVDSSNFNVGGALAGTRGVFGGLDPDNNTDNDDNGVAGPSGSVVAAPISLDYNTEPSSDGGAIPKNDVNNSLDFGFVVNTAPVANADSLSATEDTQVQYSTELTGNDTDADLDTLTITAVSNFVNGTASVASGVVTFTPNSNFNGTASFDYTISDGNGHTATATATVTVGAVNDPIGTVAPGAVSPNEDAVDFAVTGMSITDPDSTLAPAGVYEVTLSATHGTLKLTTLTGLTFTVGDGTDDTTMTFHGTLADINTAVATTKYTPTANYNGPAQINFQATDSFGGTVATGTGAATADSNIINVTVKSVNDAPSGTADSAPVVEGVDYVFLVTDFSDGFSDPIDGNSFAGVKITELASAGTLKLNGSAISANDVISLADLTSGKFTYEPAAASAGTSPTFKFAVQDNGGTANGGVDFDQSPETFTLNVATANFNPTLQLDDTGPSATLAYTENQPAQIIAPDAQLADTDSANFDTGKLTVSFQANGEAGDQLGIQNQGTGAGQISVGAGTVSYENVQIGTFTGGANGTNLVITFDPDASVAAVQALIRAITYQSLSDNPGVGSRTVNFTVTDGDGGSAQANAAVNITAVNDAPGASNANETGTEDVGYVFAAADFNFTDTDGNALNRVAITTLPTNGKLYIDLDGPGGNAPVEVQLFGPNSPAYITKAEIDAGHFYYVPNTANASGTGFDSFNFKVEDNGGTDNAGANLSGEYAFTINLDPANDSPVLTTGGPIAATEQTAVAILPAGSVSDVDLDARNGGNGDYAGASFSVNRNPATNATEDVFTLVAGPNFTIDGSNLKTAGGQIFGTISVDGSAGLIVINFTSLEAPATSALVDQVIQAVRYTNTSDSPPASVDLAVGFDDGSPGGGQGTGATDLDVNLVTVNIAPTNDAPVLDLNGAAAGTGATLAFSEGNGITPIATGATVADIDSADFAGGTLVADLTSVGNGDFLAIIDGNGITVDNGAQKVSYNGVEIATFAITNLAKTFTYTFNASADAAAVQALVRQISFGNQNDSQLSGDRTVSYTLSDGDGGTASAVTATVSVTAVNDGPVAQPDAVSTPENVVGTGSLFANNGSGPDTDPEGDPITVSEVNGSPLVSGQPIVLASGAILIVNSDGTYSYNPNGKFNRLTDNTSGAVNTSQVGDTFSYTVTGGNTVSVVVTVNGVAGPGDWLMGDGTDNTITGTPQADTFVVSQGGNDTVAGLGDDDIFYFGGALTAADNVNGGSGVDTIVLQGNYSGGLTLDGSVVEIERISLLAGSNTYYGNPGTNLYDYVITTHDDNFAAGVQARINGSALLADEDFTFDGSAETDAKFVVYGGRGKDDLTGGDGNDIFFFAEGGRFAPGDVVDGGAGYDGLFLRGNYSIDLTQGDYAGALAGLENLTVSSASDQRYGRGGGAEFDYSIIWDGDLLAAGQTMTISGALLGSEESFIFNGADETDGKFKIFSGGGIDVLTGGGGDDLIFGGGRGDTLTGGGGFDVFRYDSVTDSNSTERDGIQDFSSGDLIDLSRIDANILLDGDQAFTFIGNADFTHTAGELRFENVSGPIWLVQGDVDGNGVSDFEVILQIYDASPIASTDFML
ncbi:MAG TPA: cadherin-like domain-containing protein [Allosphingosinicella sp.]|jgi:hypothetical protein|nr:cadherin-like domain-containing protein [Allosphingosinicella sp.]